MKKKLMTVLSVLSIAVFATTAVNIGTAAEAATIVSWQQRSSGLYLRANTSKQVYTHKYNDSATKWEKISVGSNGTRLYKNSYTKQCLDSNSNGYVYTNSCSTTNKYQQWNIIWTTGPYYLQRNVGTGRCLYTVDSNSASTAKTGSCTSEFDSYDWY